MERRGFFKNLMGLLGVGVAEELRQKAVIPKPFEHPIEMRPAIENPLPAIPVSTERPWPCSFMMTAQAYSWSGIEASCGTTPNNWLGSLEEWQEMTRRFNSEHWGYEKLEREIVKYNHKYLVGPQGLLPE